MPIRWHYDPGSRLIVSGASGRVSADDIHAFLDEAEPRGLASEIGVHVHLSADASPDLLKLPELTGVAQRIDRLLRRWPKPWFKNAIITPSPVQFGVSRMVLGLIGGEAPIRVFRDVESAAGYAEVDLALVQRMLDLVLKGA